MTGGAAGSQQAAGMCFENPCSACSQAAFSDDPPVVYSPESGRTTAQQSPAAAPQQALQPAVSQVGFCRQTGRH